MHRKCPGACIKVILDMLSKFLDYRFTGRANHKQARPPGMAGQSDAFEMSACCPHIERRMSNTELSSASDST